VRLWTRFPLNTLWRAVVFAALMVGWGCTAKQDDGLEGYPVDDSVGGQSAGDSGQPAGDSGQDTGDPPLNFSRVFAVVIGPSCRGCHSGQAAAGDLRLETEAASFRTLMADYVVPDDPAASELVSRIVLDIDDDALMPPGAPLAATKVALVVDWVEAGAPE
jgi:hypothetical protein